MFLKKSLTAYIQINKQKSMRQFEKHFYIKIIRSAAGKHSDSFHIFP